MSLPLQLLAPHLAPAASRPLELLAPGPRLSKATEATLARYCDSAVDARGERRIVRTERLPPEEFCFDAAQVCLGIGLVLVVETMFCFPSLIFAGQRRKADATAFEKLGTASICRHDVATHPTRAACVQTWRTRVE